MPVVINEFEVVAEQPSAARGSGAGMAVSEQPASAPPLDACALRQLLSDLEQSRRRVWAH